MKKINLPALVCAIIALVDLIAVCCGAKHQFFFLIVFGGLAYALFTEETETTK